MIKQKHKKAEKRSSSTRGTSNKDKKLSYN